MVMLASYESIQHCAGVVTAWFSFTVEIGLYGHYKYTSAVSSASVCLATIGVWWSQKYSADWWILHQITFSYSLEEDWGRDDKAGKYCGDGQKQKCSTSKLYNWWKKSLYIRPE